MRFEDGVDGHGDAKVVSMLIFISYRNLDWPFAHRLQERLEESFSGEVYIDRKISSDNYETELLGKVRECDIFILVVTPHTFDQSRLTDDDDWIRREVALALALDKPIALVLYEGIRPPPNDVLPEDIRQISSRQGVKFYAEYFEQAVATLELHCRSIVPSLPWPSAPARKQRSPSEATRERRLEAAMPREVAQGSATEVRVKVSRVDSKGLRGELPARLVTGDEIKKSDTRQTNFPITFPLDDDGRLLPATLCVDVTAEHYDVGFLTYPDTACDGRAEIELIPEMDSRTVIFSLTPNPATPSIGLSRVTVQVFYRGLPLAETRLATMRVPLVTEVTYLLGSSALPVQVPQVLKPALVSEEPSIATLRTPPSAARSSEVRNFAILAPIDASETTERVLYCAAADDMSDKLHDGAATMDWMEPEQERSITITSPATTAFWKDNHLNIIDVLVSDDVTVDVGRNLDVLDGAVAVIDGKEGVEPWSEQLWRQADQYAVPRICFVDRMDKIGADFYFSIRTIEERLSAKAVPVQVPIGAEASFEGVVDLVEMNAKVWPVETNLREMCETVDIPAYLADKAEEYRTKLLKVVVEADEELHEKYLSGGELTVAEIKGAIRKLTISSEIYPVLCGSAFKNKGVEPMLDAVADYLPSPRDVPPATGYALGEEDREVVRHAITDEPFAALAFRTATHPFFGKLTYIRVYSGTVECGSQVINATKGKKERLGKLFQMHSNKENPVERATAGHIYAVIGLKVTTAGDTLSAIDAPVVLETLRRPG